MMMPKIHQQIYSFQITTICVCLMKEFDQTIRCTKSMINRKLLLTFNMMGLNKNLITHKQNKMNKKS